MDEHVEGLAPEGYRLSCQTHLGTKRVNSKLTEPVDHFVLCFTQMYPKFHNFSAPGS